MIDVAVSCETKLRGILAMQGNYWNTAPREYWLNASEVSLVLRLLLKKKCFRVWEWQHEPEPCFILNAYSYFDAGNLVCQNSGSVSKCVYK